jgi:hypothetical protein
MCTLKPTYIVVLKIQKLQADCSNRVISCSVDGYQDLPELLAKDLKNSWLYTHSVNKIWRLVFVNSRLQGKKFFVELIYLPCIYIARLRRRLYIRIKCQIVFSASHRNHRT